MTESDFHSVSRAQVQRLTERLLTETMGDEEFEYFESLLLNNPAARQVYIEHVEVHSQLSYLNGAAALAEGEVFAKQPVRDAVSFSRIWLVAGVMACCLMAGVVFLIRPMLPFQHGGGDQADVESKAAVGVMVASSQAAKEGKASSSSLVTIGQVLAPSTGDYQFRLSNGVACTLHGPAQLKFRSPFEVELEWGTLVAHVPPGGVGFRVETPSAQFVDLGTTFSVSTDAAGGSELRVFQGAVSARSKSGGVLETSPLLVSAHQTVRFSPTGEAKPADIPTPDPQDVQRGLMQLYGIRKLKGTIQLLPAAPVSVQLGKLQSDTAIFLIHEQSCVELVQPLVVVPPHPQSYSKPGTFVPLELPAGTRCASYLLHCDFKDGEQMLSGTVVFDRPILGVIFSSDGLQHSDRLFALKGLKYPSDEQVFEKGLSRGCVIPYGGKGEMEDTVILHEDGCSLTVSLNSPGGNMDQVRVLVQAADP